MNPDSVTNCMRCGTDLERGYSSRYVGNECTEVICFKCDKKESTSDFMKTGVITTHFMMDCMLEVYDLLKRLPSEFHGSWDTHDEAKLTQLLDLDLTEEQKAKVHVQIATARICNKVKEFESKVWFKGLQDQILAEKKERGISARLGKKHKNFKVMTWTGMGRTMITIEDDEASVTCVADETSKESRTGFHGISATGEQALALYDKAIALYEDGTLKFKVDKKVSLF
jgi:hypothetical protein